SAMASKPSKAMIATARAPFTLSWKDRRNGMDLEGVDMVTMGCSLQWVDAWVRWSSGQELSSFPDHGEYTGDRLPDAFEDRCLGSVPEYEAPTPGIERG